MEWKSRRSFCRYELCESAVIVSAGAELAGSIVAMLIAKANNTPTERIVKANRVMIRLQDHQRKIIWNRGRRCIDHAYPSRRLLIENVLGETRFR